MGDHPIKRRLAAILAADVAGYTRLMEQDTDGTVVAWRGARTDIIDPGIAEHDGRIIKHTGDGFLAEFGSVMDAVRCAITMQDGLASSDLDFRMGVNLGDIIDDGDDIHGEGVNLAARLEGLAEPGGIVISSGVYDQVKNRIDAGYEDMGEQSLKNIEEPIRAYRVFGDRDLTEMSASPRKSLALEFSPPDRPSVAILPFKSLGSDPDKEFIADGIRFGISASLVQLSGLFLVHAPILNAYRGKDVSALSVGEELDARYVLEGAVQQAGNRVRVTVQLTDVETNQVTLADRYDRVLDDVFELQDEITREVISSLNINLVANEIDRVWFGKLAAEAKEAYYRGASHFYELNEQDNVIARRYFEELYRVQPDSVVGPSYISVTYWMDAFFSWTDSVTESIEQAAIWAQKAMEYEENNGIGFAVYGYLQILEGNYDEALANCTTGVKLRTSCPMAHALLGIVHNYCGDAGSAVNSVREALQLERVYPTWLIDILAAAYRDRGAIELSIPAAEESLRLNPQNNEARLILCSNYQLEADHEQARRVAGEIIASDPEFRLSNYAKSQPYKNPATLKHLIETLRKAGLPQ